MNTWGYLILITALLVLSAFMLYARFAGRSREKSVHHAPTELANFAVVTRSVTAEREGELPTDPIVMDLMPRRETQVEEKSDAEETGESSYFDELQDAAAGLAMLMRSSPAANRTGPVVFEPEGESELSNGDSAAVEGPSGVLVKEETASQEEEVVEVDSPDECVAEIEVQEIESDLEGEAATEPIGIEIDVVDEKITELSVNVIDEIEEDELSPVGVAMDTVEALLEEGPAFDESEDEIAVAIAEAQEPVVAVETRTEATSLELVLGDQIAEQFSRIDSGLDELESLVQSIEDQLAGLEDFISAPLDAGIGVAA